MRRDSFLLLLALLVVGLGLSSAAAAMGKATHHAQTRMSGWFTSVTSDPLPGSTEPSRLYVLLQDDYGNNLAQLDVDYATLFAYNRQRVTITAEVSAEVAEPLAAGIPRLRPLSIEAAPDQPLAEAALGSQPWVNVLCEFPDAGTPTGSPPNAPAYYENLLRDTEPGLNHYWQTLSYGQLDITGSQTTSQWYTMPKSYASYMSGTTVFLGLLAADCAAQADAEVNFPNFAGINFFFDAPLGCCGYGGNATVTLDGVTKNYRMTWIPPSANLQVWLAHEMGHGFGLPHSSGPHDDPPSDLGIYVSDWDVMSSGRTSTQVPGFGYLGTGTIGYYLTIGEWADPARVVTVAPGDSQIVTLERLQTAATPTDPLYVQVPISGSAGIFYTVEARDLLGYDVGLPASGVLIHRVNLGYYDPTNRGPALVVDEVDGNNNVNDAGGVWLPGETYTDALNGVTISVLAQTANGYQVQVTNNAITPPPNDEPTSAIPFITATGLDVQSTVYATKSGAEPSSSCDATLGNTVWYQLTAPSDGKFILTSAGSNFDTVLSVYSGAPGSLTEVACNDDYSGYSGRSRVDLQATSGVTYYISVGGYGGANGDMELQLSYLGTGILVVNVTSDGEDFNIFDGGACDSNALLPGFQCSLRAAIQNANADSITDTITFDPAVFSTPQTINLVGNLPDLATPMIIDGPDDARVTINAGNAVGRRPMTINPGSAAAIELRDLTFTGGNCSASCRAVNTGGGGLMVFTGRLTLVNSTITGNSAVNGGGFYSFTTQPVTITNSIITANTATGNGGGMHVTSTPLTISATTISANTGSQGGALFISSTTNTTITNSTLSGNTAAIGGAINNGLSNVGMTITNSTITGNRATNTAGAIRNRSALTVINSTITGNYAGSEPTNTGVAGGVRTDNPFIAQNTIIAGNIGHATYRDCGGGTMQITGNAHNVLGASCAPNGTDISATDPLLAALANNGGATQTMLPLDGSPVINAGDNAYAAGLTTDQRAAPRIYDSIVDIGAVERAQISALSITRLDPDPSNAAAVSWQVAFSDPASGVTSANFELVASGVTDATITDVSANGATWTVTASTGNGDGSLGLNLVNGTDITPIIVSAFPVTGEVYTLERAAPTVVIASAEANPTSASSIPVTITFSEPVVDFDATDLVIGNGISLNFTGSGANYAFDLVPAAAGVITVDVAASAAQDAAGNPNEAAAQFSITFNIPTVAVTGITRADASPTNAAQVSWTVTFSGAVSGVSLTNFDLVAASGLTGTSLTNIAGGGTTWTVTANTGTKSGLLTLRLTNTTGILATVTNPLPYVGQFYLIDRSLPSASLASPATNPTTNNPIPVTVTFSESVIDFDATDLVIGNGTAQNFAGSGKTYTFDLVPTAGGTVTVNLPAGAAHDTAGNANSAAAQFSRTYIPPIPPVTLLSITRANATPNSGAQVSWTVTFSGAASGVSLTNFDLIAASGLTGTSLANVTGDGTTWTVTANAGTNSGLLTLRLVNATGITPGLTNSLPYVGQQYQIDHSLPRPVVSSTAPNPTTLNPIPVTVTFSESVTNFDMGDLIVGNGTPQNFAGSGKTYTFDLAPDADGLVTVNIAANAAQDIAGNWSTAAAQFSRAYTASPSPVTLPLPGLTSIPFDLTGVIVPGQITLAPANDPLTLDGGTLAAATGACFEGALPCGSFLLLLDAPPSADVVVTVSVSDPTEIALIDPRVGSAPAASISFVFSATGSAGTYAWDTGVMVSVAARADGIVERNEEFTITITTTSADPSFNGLAALPYLVTVANTDFALEPPILVTPEPEQPEGGAPPSPETTAEPPAESGG